MTRINLKLNRFASSNWVFKIRETALRFAKPGRLSRGWRLPAILFSAAVLMQLCAVSAVGQLSITFLEKNRRRVTLPTTEVTRKGVRRGPAQPITVIPMTLEVGDELIGNTGAVASSPLQLSGGGYLGKVSRAHAAVVSAGLQPLF